MANSAEGREEWLKITTVEMHTGGEPLRVLTGGLPEIKGDTILEKRRYFRDHYDHIRTACMWEPRGHADMYGAVITEATSKDSDFGTFFMHNEGYSTMCGHAIIALVKYVLEMEVINMEEKDPLIRIDAPPGLIIARAYRNGHKVEKVSFRNVPSYVLLRDGMVQVKDLGDVRFDIAFGGAYYAIVDAKQLGLKLHSSAINKIIDAGRKIKHAVIKQFPIEHPFEEDLGFLYGTIFTGLAEHSSNHSRNVCIFADGELDRSATGSGVSARAALLHAEGQLIMGEKISIESILGSTMDVEVAEETSYGPHKAVIPEVTGQAWFTGKNEIWLDPDDPFVKGFIFR